MIRVSVDTDALIAEARRDPRLSMLPVGVIRTMFVAGNVVFLWVQVEEAGRRNNLLEVVAEQIHTLCHILLAEQGLNGDEQDYAFTVVDRLLAREIEAANVGGKLDAIKGKAPALPSTVKES
jgi:hypothetical protein